VVEARERILPTYDAELTAPVAESLKKLGIALHLGHSVEGYADGCLLAAMARAGNCAWRPTRCWWPWAAARAPRASTWKA
jgi:NADPH-dependent 2,4-dienoyl-CoA reductase/sulfur reductase-like enzyme